MPRPLPWATPFDMLNVDHLTCRRIIVTRHAACIGGLLSVAGGDVNVVATTFEWAEDIDIERAALAEEKALAKLASNSLSETDRKIWEAKYRRAVVRKNTAKNNR